MAVGLRIVLMRVVTFALLVSLLSVFPALHAVAQEWSLGSSRFATTAVPNSRPLQITSTGRANLASYRFVSRVGGVSFEAVARPDPSLAGASIELSYNPALPDGSRLVVRAGSNVLRSNISDWQLQPLANYINSEFNAAVSLFGDGPDSERYYYPQYHDALKNTLLGMRLFHADVLFMSLSDHWRMPRYGGNLILGHGERDSREDQSIQAAQRIGAVLRQHQWRAWVLTDAGTQPTFGTNKNEILIRAAPYFYFWNVDEKEEATIRAASKRLIDEHEQVRASYNSNIDRYNSLVKTHNATPDSGRRRALDEQLNSLDKEINEQKRRLEALRTQVDSDKLQPRVFEVTALTQGIRGLDSALAQYNPAVYRSFQRVAQYGSLFRYVKQNNVGNWQSFREAVARISIQPTVKTPTSWERRTR